MTTKLKMSHVNKNQNNHQIANASPVITIEINVHKEMLMKKINLNYDILIDDFGATIDKNSGAYIEYLH